MPEAIPRFFFSYSQADADDSYLKRFFEALRKRVSDLSGLAIKKTDPDADERLNLVGFRDAVGVKTGEDWREKLGKAIQNNGVLVCIYSANFFSRVQTKQFCGREFTAFLMRHPEYDPATGRARDLRHVLPVLWWDLKNLESEGLPPEAVKFVQWTVPETADGKLATSYLELGLRKIMMGHRSKYETILTYFAKQIKELAREPLPPLDDVPDIEALPSAWRWPIEGARNHAPPPVVEPAEASGPHRLLIVEIRLSMGGNEWTPYEGEETIQALFEKIANQKNLHDRSAKRIVTEWKRLDPSVGDFLPQVLAALKEATDNSIRSILLVDPRCLAHDAARAALIALLNERCRAGIILPADARDADVTSLIEAYRNDLKPSADPRGWVVRITAGDIMDFRVAVTSVASDILARMVNADPVRQRAPDNGGPNTKPRITNKAASDERK